MDKLFVEPIQCQDCKPLSAVAEAPELEYATYGVTKGEIFGHSSAEPAAYLLQQLAVRHLVSSSR